MSPGIIVLLRRLLSRATSSPATAEWRPVSLTISNPADGGLVGNYAFGRAWARVGRKIRGRHEVEDIFGDLSVPGRGTALLQHICRRADERGCTLVIQVVPPHERRTEEEKARLRTLYAKHGFGEYTGRDPEKWMLREPRSVHPDETTIDENA